jgi:hypothetical protein
MLFLLLRFLMRNLLFFDGFAFIHHLFFSPYSIQYSFSVLCVCSFNYNMLLYFVQLCCPGCFLYLNGQNFLKIWEIFCYYFIEYIYIEKMACTFSPSMPMILRFVLLMESLSLCIFLSQVLSCLTNTSSVFFFNFYFIFEL